MKKVVSVFMLVLVLFSGNAFSGENQTYALKGVTSSKVIEKISQSVKSVKNIEFSEKTKKMCTYTGISAVVVAISALLGVGVYKLFPKQVVEPVKEIELTKECLTLVKEKLVAMGSTLSDKALSLGGTIKSSIPSFSRA